MTAQGMSAGAAKMRRAWRNARQPGPRESGDAPILRVIDEMLSWESDDVKWLLNVNIPPSDEAMQRDLESGR